MDLPDSLTQTSVQTKGSSPPASAALETGLLNAPGRELQALVTEVQRLTAAEQKALVALLVKEAEGIKNLANTSLPNQASTKPQPEAPKPQSLNSNTSQLSLSKQTHPLLNLLALSQAAKSTQNNKIPELFAIELLVGRHKLLTLSSTPLKSNQKVSLTITAQGQLNLISTKAKPAGHLAGKDVQSTIQNKVQSSIQAKAAYSISKTQGTHNPTLEKGLPAEPSSIALSSIKQGLKNHLPAQAPVSKILSQFSRALDALALTAPKKNSALPEKIVSQLQQIVKHVIEPSSSKTSSYNNSKALENQIIKSGFFLEKTLSQLAKEPSQVKKTPSVLHTTQNLSGAKTQTSTGNAKLTDALNTDLKAQLIKLSALAEDELNQSYITKLASNIGSSSANMTANTKGLISLFDNLLKVFGRSSKEQTVTAKKAELLQAVHLASAAAASKIAVSQIQKLAASIQEGTSLNGGTFELPIKIGDSIYPLSMTLYDTWKRIDDKEEKPDSEKDKTNKKQRQWHLFMEFDLDHSGWVSCEVTASNHEIKTKLWAEKEATRTSIKDHLDDLQQAIEKDGVSVEKMECLEGIPLQKKNVLSQSLVDITT